MKEQDNIAIQISGDSEAIIKVNSIETLAAWIDPKHLRPLPMTDVLVSVDLKGKLYVIVGWDESLQPEENLGWCTFDKTIDMSECDVIAWAPLPKPYDGKKEKLNNEISKND